MNDVVVVFNSRVGATGANRNDLLYNYDWSLLKETKYEVSFSIMMETGTWNGDKIPILFGHLGTTPLVYKTGTQNVSANTEVMGMLKYNILQNATPALATYAYANGSDNPSIHLNSKPTNTSPRFTFRDATGALLTDSAGAEIGHYYLIMRFTEKHDLPNHKDRYA